MRALTHTSVYYHIDIVINADTLERIFEVLLRLYLIMGAALYLAQRIEAAVYWLADLVQSIEYTVKVMQVIFNSFWFATVGG